MVIWCKTCGALIGLREPRDNWSTRCGICASCLDKKFGIARVDSEKDTLHENTPDETTAVQRTDPVKDPA